MLPFVSAMLLAGAAGPPLVPVTIGGDATASITLSNGNLTATKDATTGVAYAFGGQGRATGKWRFQCRLDALPTQEVNIGLSGALYIGYSGAFGGYLGNDDQGIGLNTNSRGVITGASTQYGVANPVAGDVLDVFADLDIGRVWFAKNGIILNGDPAAGTGGTAMPAMRKAWFPTAYLNGANSAVTFNFGGSAFTYGYAGLGAFQAWSAASPPASLAQFRSFAILIRSPGWFSQAYAELELMTASGGANMLAGAAASSSAPLTDGSFAAGTDGNTATYTAVGYSGGANQPPLYIAYDLGANAARNAAFMAIRGRSGGGGAQDQAPRLFDLWVSAGPAATGDWYKTPNLGVALGAFAATTPGERKEFAL